MLRGICSFLCLKHNVALLGQYLDASLAIGCSLVLNERRTQLVHAPSTSEALRMPKLIESLNMGVSQRKRVVAATAGGFWNAFVVDWAAIRIDQMCARDGLVTFSAAKLLAGTFSAEDALFSVEEVAIQTLAAAGANKVIGVPVLIKRRNVGASDLSSTFSADNNIAAGRRSGFRDGYRSGAASSGHAAGR